MSSPFADLSKKSNDLSTKAFPVDKKDGPRDHKIAKVAVASKDGVKIEASFENTHFASGEKNVSKVDVTSGNAKVSLNSKDTALGLSLWVEEKLTSGSKFQLELKTANKDGALDGSVALTASVKKDNFNGQGKVEAFVDSKVEAEVCVIGRREKVQFGVEAKLSNKDAGIAGFKSVEGAAAFEFSDSIATTGAVYDVSKGSFAAKATYYQRLCSDCDGQVAVVAQFPIPGLRASSKDIDVKAAGSWNLAKDTTASVVATSGFDLGLALKVKLNDSVTVSGSTYASVLGKGNRVFGLNVDVSN